MIEVVEVKLTRTSQVKYFDSQGLDLNMGDLCIVETEGGRDFGRIVAEPKMVQKTKVSRPLYKVIRKATDDDMERIEANSAKAKETFTICSRKIADHELAMKLVNVEYAFDGSKIVFYFTAAKRVDFRELVRDLARLFKKRIELKQIGVRDEAGMLGGYGPCGRPLCCSILDKDFEPVSIRMAKEQGLTMSPSKISGLCGRLMCCLAYEHSTYREARKRLPRVGSKVVLAQGRGEIEGVNFLKESVIVRLEGGSRLEVPVQEIKR